MKTILKTSSMWFFKTIKLYSLCTLCLCGAIFFSCTNTFNSIKSELITIDQAKKIFAEKSAIWIDARMLDWYKDGHVPGALNLPMFEFEDSSKIILKNIDKKARIITYCSEKDCGDSKELQEKLLTLGYVNVKVFKGGYKEWEEAKLPVEKNK